MKKHRAYRVYRLAQVQMRQADDRDVQILTTRFSNFVLLQAGLSFLGTMLRNFQHHFYSFRKPCLRSCPVQEAGSGPREDRKLDQPQQNKLKRLKQGHISISNVHFQLAPGSGRLAG